MKLYYKAVDSEGKKVSGLIDARDAREVATYLRGHKLTPIKIKSASSRGFSRITLFSKPKLKDRIFFTRQISTMLSSGLTLMQSLAIVKNQISNPVMANVVNDVITSVESGKIFSESLQKHPDLFPPIYISLIRTAESSGLLDKVLLRLADNLEKQDKLERTIRSAILYPAVVIIIMVLVMIIMLIFVFPQLTSLYESINIPLPFSTKIVLGISGLLIHAWYLLIAAAIGGIYLFRRFYRQELGRRIVDGVVLKVPVFGKLLSQTMMAEFSRTLGLLIGAGSLVVDSLVKSSEVVGNILYKDAIVLLSKRVEKGITIGDAMSASPLFPPMVVEMVKIGEQTGKLEDSLLKSSEYFEQEVDQTVKNLSTIIEPVIIVVLAIGVGFLIFSIITPIYGLISSIQ
ncbi:MAG TPA: type II secretion system F family protein [Xanthomonadales bacterium]|nr:type II secretion system F family protein [Xanthomonadales bacterium]